jgi:hypothetical protein
MNENTKQDSENMAASGSPCSAWLGRGKHTPGPWRYDHAGSEIMADHATDEYGNTPVRVLDLHGAMGGDDCTADARLLAAAPELLDACRAALSFVRGKGKNLPAVAAQLEGAIRTALDAAP